jgi:hypothetical protein
MFRIMRQAEGERQQARARKPSIPMQTSSLMQPPDGVHWATGPLPPIPMQES